MTFNQSTALALQRRFYPDGLESQLYKGNTVFGLAKKWTGFTNEAKYLVWNDAPGGGASATFSNAQTNVGAGDYVKPLITRVSEYALAEIAGETLDATDNREAIASAFKVAMDHALYNIKRSVGIQMFGDTTGTRATVVSVASDVATVGEGETRNFEIGMVCQSVNAGTPRSGTGVVTAIDHSANTVEFGTIVSGTTGGDTIIRDGDDDLTISGFADWIPRTAPTSGTFFGASRVGKPRTFGLRQLHTSGLREECLMNSATHLHQFGEGDGDFCVLNPIDWNKIAKEKGSREVVPVKTKVPSISYKAFELMTPSGTMRVFADPNCPVRDFWMGELGDLEIWSNKEFPRVLMGDGLRMLRKASADTYEFRVGGYLQMVIKNPFKWLYGQFPNT